MLGWPDCLEAELIYININFLARHCNKFQLSSEIWNAENCLEYSFAHASLFYEPPCPHKILWSDTSTSLFLKVFHPTGSCLVFQCPIKGKSDKWAASICSSVAVNCSPTSRPPSELRTRNSSQLSSIVTMRTLTLIALAALLAVVVARAGPRGDQAGRKPGTAAGRRRVDPDAMTDAEGEEFEKVSPKQSRIFKLNAIKIFTNSLHSNIFDLSKIKLHFLCLKFMNF